MSYQRPALVIIESLEQLHGRCLAVTAGAHDRNEVTRLYFKVKATQDVKIRSSWVVEPDVLVADVGVTALLEE